MSEHPVNDARTSTCSRAPIRDGLRDLGEASPSPRASPPFVESFSQSEEVADAAREHYYRTVITTVLDGLERRLRERGDRAHRPRSGPRDRSAVQVVEGGGHSEPGEALLVGQGRQSLGDGIDARVVAEAAAQHEAGQPQHREPSFLPSLLSSLV